MAKTNRITITVTLKTDYKYEDFSFSYYGETKHIYAMQDDEGTAYVWKTASILCIGEIGIEDECELIEVGDKFELTASVKEVSEYKGNPQTVLTRVKPIRMVTKGKKPPTWEEIQMAKREEQLASVVKGFDFIWRMPYRQYKMHYADCETVALSYEYDEARGMPMIQVIIRAGRLKNSGVRGQRFAQYIFKNEDGDIANYRAVSADNAYRRCIKEHPESSWELEFIQK